MERKGALLIFLTSLIKSKSVIELEMLFDPEMLKGGNFFCVIISKLVRKSKYKNELLFYDASFHRVESFHYKNVLYFPPQLFFKVFFLQKMHFFPRSFLFNSRLSNYLIQLCQTEFDCN